MERPRGGRGEARAGRDATRGASPTRRGGDDVDAAVVRQVLERGAARPREGHRHGRVGDQAGVSRVADASSRGEERRGRGRGERRRRRVRPVGVSRHGEDAGGGGVVVVVGGGGAGGCDDRGRGVGRRREGVSEGVVDEGARNDGGRNREMKFLRRMES
eukprot:17487-Pelagococcus_subviridis.AAC.1